MKFSGKMWLKVTKRIWPPAFLGFNESPEINLIWMLDEILKQTKYMEVWRFLSWHCFFLKHFSLSTSNVKLFLCCERLWHIIIVNIPICKAKNCYPKTIYILGFIIMYFLVTTFVGSFPYITNKIHLKDGE